MDLEQKKTQLKDKSKEECDGKYGEKNKITKKEERNKRKEELLFRKLNP